jgi:predicted nuclease with TOPRIM domain
MKEIDITDEQFKQINELSAKYNESIYNIGVLSFNKSQIEEDLKNINDDHAKLVLHLKELNIQEQTIISNFTKLYGECEIDIERKKIRIK